PPCPGPCLPPLPPPLSHLRPANPMHILTYAPSPKRSTSLLLLLRDDSAAAELNKPVRININSRCGTKKTHQVAGVLSYPTGRRPPAPPTPFRPSLVHRAGRRGTRRRLASIFLPISGGRRRKAPATACPTARADAGASKQSSRPRARIRRGIGKGGTRLHGGALRRV
uniref:Uncharacterized protein n=1 Tax=Aegilops tauschii subsp. strangulata TaxID=200361 RepID=A0A453PR53_AEGTS